MRCFFEIKIKTQIILHFFFPLFFCVQQSHGFKKMRKNKQRSVSVKKKITDCWTLISWKERKENECHCSYILCGHFLDVCFFLCFHCSYFLLHLNSIGCFLVFCTYKICKSRAKIDLYKPESSGFYYFWTLFSLITFIF